jgi:hypothetical protein
MLISGFDMASFVIGFGVKIVIRSGKQKAA